MLPTPSPRNGMTARWPVELGRRNGDTSTDAWRSSLPAVAGLTSVRWTSVCCLVLFCLASSPAVAQQPRQQRPRQVRPVAPQQRRTTPQQPPRSVTQPPPSANPTPPATEPQNSPAAEQPAAEPPAAEPPVGSVESQSAQLTKAILEAAAKAAAADEELSEEQKQRVSELYAGALLDLERAEQLEKRAKSFMQLREDSEQRAEAARTQQEQLRDAKPTPPDSADVVELEAELNQLQSELESVKEAKLQLDDQATRRASRRNDIRQRLADLDGELITAKQEAAAPPLATDPALITESRRNVALSRFRALLAEKPALENELALFDAEAALNLLQLNRAVNARQLKLLEEQVEITRQARAEARSAAAGSAVADAVRDESEVPHLLRPIAEETRQFAERNQQLTDDIEQLEVNRQVVSKRLDDLRKSYNQAQAKVESIGLSASVGAMLRKVRTELPDAHDLRVSGRERRAPIDDAQLSLFDLDEQRGRLADLDQAALVTLQELPDAPVTDGISRARALA